ncbi:hypothetical protein HPB49_012274 [Dermacentor silvarum]|uniref:Uncharacterized protein n=1 Tax=Dermacentor silvarum TaxID=543639 RepID=A0ACB8DD82_DERSI|nr:hypothetical protein HPB49_012274 [Dermacentor silvarum]
MLNSPAATGCATGKAHGRYFYGVSSGVVSSPGSARTTYASPGRCTGVEAMDREILKSRQPAQPWEARSRGTCNRRDVAERIASASGLFFGASVRTRFGLFGAQKRRKQGKGKGRAFENIPGISDLECALYSERQAIVGAAAARAVGAAIRGVWLSYRHVQYPGLSFGVPMPVNMVTALVDSIHSEDMEIRPRHDLKLRGHISWVGRTSMEVTMELLSLAPEQTKHLLTAKFVMVAMQANASNTVPVNKLVPKNDEEQAIFEEGAASVARRKKFQASGILKQPPTHEERDLLHKLFLEDFDPDGRRPKTYHTDDIWFRKPVELGSLLHYDSQVVYTQDNFVQVNVNATVIKPEIGTKEITNVFHFTFCLDGENPAPRVIPRSYPESMLYIEGKRYLDHAMSKRQSPASHSHSHSKSHNTSHGSGHESKKLI